MRLQVMTHGGPFDGHLFTHNSIENVPPELRLALFVENFDEEKVPAALYRLVDHETYTGARTTFVSYRYLRDIESRFGLVDVWIGKEER